jgi:hypothetical protein
LAIFKLKFEPCEKKTLVLVEIAGNKVFRSGNKGADGAVSRLKATLNPRAKTRN